MANTITISDSGIERTIGPGYPTFVIAEIGINHNGDVEQAKTMIDVAKQSGADGVKLQSFVADEFVSDPDVTYSYYSQGEQVTEQQYELFYRHELTQDTLRELFSYAREQGILIFSTPQDNTFAMVDFLCDELAMPVIKVGSDDLTNLELMARYAAKGVPMIISSGMATIDEVEDAVHTIEAQGNNELVILYCSSLYPTPPEECHLNRITTLRYAYDDHLIGFSDHTQGATAPTLSVLLGAHVIEKHFTLDHNLPGPDHWFSADSAELARMVSQVRAAQAMPGRSRLAPSAAELEAKKECRRFVVAATDIPEGHTIGAEDVESGRTQVTDLRECLLPKYKPMVIGRQAGRSLKKGEAITPADLRS